jgi:hypothetical protein
MQPSGTASDRAHLCKTYSRIARDTLIVVTMTISAAEAVEAAKLMDWTKLAILAG